MKAFVKQLIKAKETKAIAICFEANPEYFWEEVKSSNIKRVRHSQELVGTLDIEFSSAQVYRYERVPLELYKNLLLAESVGQFFIENLRANYLGVKLITKK